MSLKLLVVPLCVIGILVVSIGYIKPDVTVLSAKKDQLDVVNTQVASLDTLVSNVQSMKSQINSAKSDASSTVTDAVFLTTSYFPSKSDVERSIDQLNYLATQSGSAVNDIQVADVKPTEIAKSGNTENMAVDSSASALMAQPDGTTPSEPVQSVRKTYTPTRYTVTLHTTGTYDSAKKLYSAITDLKRFAAVQSVQLGVQKDAGPDQKLPTDFLESEIVVEFSILSPVMLASAFGDLAFEKNTLDFSAIAAIRKTQQSAIPELPVGNLGKTSLFQ